MDSRVSRQSLGMTNPSTPAAGEEGRSEDSSGIEFQILGDNRETMAAVRSSSIQPEAERSRRGGRLLEQLVTSSKNLLTGRSRTHWLLLLLSCTMMMTAFPAASIVTRLYYLDGGTSKWLISWLSPSGWPISAAFLVLFCWIGGERPTPLSWKVTLAYAGLGLLSLADNFMFAYAYAYLPLSTASLLSSSSLVFTAILAYFIVGQRFNASTVNAVVFMSIATVILGLDSNTDRPYGVSSSEYTTGFVFIIGGSALHGLIFALSELVFISLLGRKSLRVALELQTGSSIFATIFTTVAVLIVGDFQKIHGQAEAFHHGPSAYYQVLVWTAVTFQLGILGSVGVLYLASTLMAGVFNAARVPVTAVAAVVVFNDPMGGYKILSIVVTVWSFATYLWGSYKQQRRPAHNHGVSTLQTFIPLEDEAVHDTPAI